VEILGSYLKDNVKAHWMQPDGTYARAPRHGAPFCAQDYLMQLTAEKHGANGS
jgi:polyphosphate kinase